ncbi:phosphopantothenoylcysteine decarboxylase / phosphopantothenate--cysteine ligase [Verrucomicrobium sp. GAS474]|uniref:flavoprotein n=1 Tax=Verrucomicrobium sp. GAS474 TaxID=1882831 RepID=UPI00087B3EE5|nr:flavoprotein [Verrucomicrobium sp. GAS474]SDU15031.1 phosphopantothenoylcysteine decarboxylase / phosphopantothenate--cysteine ligase [Verrucomicrobium sp. GAS474]
MKGKAKRILLGVTGSISAYRAVDLASLLTKEGVEVDVILTKEGSRFITPLAFSCLTKRPAYVEDGLEEGGFRPTHIGLADDADLALVAPATAHHIGLLAQGLSPDLLSSALLALPEKTPILFAPAMNGKMWRHPAVAANVKTLTQRGVRWIGPDKGLLACGYEGIGRLWPVNEIFKAAMALL